MPKQKVKKDHVPSIKLTEADKLIIESYKTTLEGLADYFGEAFEFVLHDLGDFDHSVVKIVKGFHSGRKEGAPITNLALSMLKQIQENYTGNNGQFISYTAKSKYGKPLRSSTIVILNGKKKPIGLLCINLYLESPISSLFQNFSFNQSEYIVENFTSDSAELISQALEKVKNEVESDTSVPPAQKNKKIITILYHQGVFKLKNAVQDISKDLGISKNTVYLHIRSLEDKLY